MTLPRPEGAQALRVLLVEDNPADRRLAEIALAEGAEGHDVSIEVDSVVTLHDGLARLAGEDARIDVAILDLQLPDADGIDCLTAARTANPDLPVVVLTGLSREVLAPIVLAAGASDFISKNELEPDALVGALRKAVRRE